MQPSLFRTRAFLPGYLAAMALLAVAPAAHAASVTVTGTGIIGDNVYDGIDSIVPGGSPTSSDSLIDSTIDGLASATTTFLASNSALSVAITDVRNGTAGAFAQSDGGIYFTVQPNVPGGILSYTLSGNYAVTDVSLVNPGFVDFYAYLIDQTPGAQPLVVSQQESISSLNESLVLGQTSGDYFNHLYGSLTGNLVAGHPYELYYNILTEAYPDADSGASATGNVTLSFSDASAVTAVPLPASAGMGFSMLAGCAVFALFRRRRSLLPAV